MKNSEWVRSVAARQVAWIVLIFFLAAAGCGGKKNPTAPTPLGPWEYPASSGFAVALQSDASTYSSGDSIDIKVFVAYNLSRLFGASFSISFTPHMGFDHVLYNPEIFSNPSTFLGLPVRSDGTPDPDRVSFGFTYIRGSNQSFDGSGVLLRLRGVANDPGRVILKLDPSVLALRDSTGNSIPNFESLVTDSLMITVR